MRGKRISYHVNVYKTGDEVSGLEDMGECGVKLYFPLKYAIYSSVIPVGVGVYIHQLFYIYL